MDDGVVTVLDLPPFVEEVARHFGSLSHDETHGAWIAIGATWF